MVLPAAAVLLGACGFTAGGDAAQGAVDVVPVKRGPLRITVIEGGDLASANPTIIRSRVEGRAAITYLAPEGKHVQKADVLVRLDTSSLEERLNRAESDLTMAESAVEQAQAAVDIQRKKNQENEISARTDVELAQQALQAYKEGTFPLEKRQLTSQLTIAKEKLARARDRAEASERLYKKTFISKTELEADQLAYNQAREEVDIAQRRLEQLEKWTKVEEIQKLETQLQVKRLAKARVEQENASDLKQKLRTLESRRNDLKLKREYRDKLKEQFEACEILAPRDGLVVYARRSRGRHGRDEPIDLGREVHEREEIMRIPDLSDMVVEVDIHESQVKKVRTNQRAWISIDALPDKVLMGTVVHVSPVPSSQSSWLNPDLKVYLTRVRLDEVPEGLKPGMHARVEVLVKEIGDALQLPLQAVRPSGTRTFVYVKRGREVELREIKVGENNQSAVEILGGLEEGELVYLAAPPGAPDLPVEKPKSLPPGEEGAPGGMRPGPTGDSGLPEVGRDGGPPRRGPPGHGGGGEGRGAWRERWAGMSPEERKEFLKRYRRRGGRAPERRDTGGPGGNGN